MATDNLNDVFRAAASWYTQERDALALVHMQRLRNMDGFDNSCRVAVLSEDVTCHYCHGVTTNDARGACSACGAPRGE